MKHGIISAACLLVGLLLGYWIPKGDTGGVEDVTAGDGDTANLSRSPQRSELGGGDRTRVSREREEIKLSSSGWVSVPTEFLHQLGNAHALQSSRVDLFGGDGSLLKSLGITEQEKKTLEGHWADARQAIQALEVRESRAQQLDDGSVEIKIPDMSRAIIPVSKDFGDSVEKVIGRDRASVLMAVKKVDQALGAEAGERKYHISVESVGNGDWRYHMTYESGDARRVWVGESVPNEIRHITDAARVTPSLADFNEQQGK